MHRRQAGVGASPSPFLSGLALLIVRDFAYGYVLPLPDFADLAPLRWGFQLMRWYRREFEIYPANAYHRPACRSRPWWRPALHYYSLPTKAMDMNRDLELHSLLQQLQVEHRDLDLVVGQLLNQPVSDELLLRRLKKRKLQLKDRISQLERLLEPDELA